MPQGYVQAGLFAVYEGLAPISTPVQLTEMLTLYPTTPCFDIHIIDPLIDEHPEIKQQARRAVPLALEVLAHYVSLRRGFNDAQLIIGTTHQKIGQIASNDYGFNVVDDIPYGTFPPNREKVIKEKYGGKLALVWTHVDSFLERYLAGSPTEFIRNAATMKNTN
jgi:hypothetical protein